MSLQIQRFELGEHTSPQPLTEHIGITLFSSGGEDVAVVDARASMADLYVIDSVVRTPEQLTFFNTITGTYQYTVVTLAPL